jgi:hypothetical protein
MFIKRNSILVTIIIFILLFSVSLFCKNFSEKEDNEAISKSYIKYLTIVGGQAQGDIWSILRSDSGGVLFITEAVYETNDSDTMTITDDKSLMVFDRPYDKFTIYLDSPLLPFWVSWGTDTTIAERTAAGGILNVSVSPVDSIYIWTESGSSKVCVTKRKRAINP